MIVCPQPTIKARLVNKTLNAKRKYRLLAELGGRRKRKSGATRQHGTVIDSYTMYLAKVFCPLTAPSFDWNKFALTSPTWHLFNKINVMYFYPSLLVKWEMFDNLSCQTQCPQPKTKHAMYRDLYLDSENLPSIITPFKMWSYSGWSTIQFGRKGIWGFSPCSLVLAISPTELLCAGLSSARATSSLVIVRAEEELVEEAATAIAVEGDGACLESPPAAPLMPLWLAAVCLDGLRWLPAAGLLE